MDGDHENTAALRIEIGRLEITLQPQQILKRHVAKQHTATLHQILFNRARLQDRQDRRIRADATCSLLQQLRGIVAGRGADQQIVRRLSGQQIINAHAG